MRFAAGITVYNPSDEQIKRTLSYTQVFDKVFIFDNSDSGSSHVVTSNGYIIEVLSENGNKGLPYAFNQILKRCEGFDFLCTLDQDSDFPPSEINSIKNFIENTNTDDIGIIAPFIDYGIKSYSVCEISEERRWVITSGSFVNLHVIMKERIFYDENYFIDKFEIDLCEQLKNRNYRIVMYHGSTLHQELGESNGHTHTNHSPLRHYYLFRNRFYFNKKWHTGIKRCFLNIAQTTRHVLLIILYEENKINKISQLKEAYLDFKNSKFGKK